jgi:LPXTG-site transpeptidase (sortase) family protein
LFIPSVNIRSPIKTFPLNGESWDIDLWEPLVGHLEGTAWLNMTGNIVLGGHSELPDRKPGIFAGLYNVGPGDEVFLREGEVDRRYLVVEVRVVKREDLSVVYPTNHNRLTLIASHIPSYVPGTDLYTERLIVIAHMIE